MKILITMLLTFFVVGAAYAYTPPDSCLKMALEHNPDSLIFNPDSVMIDICPDSPTFEKLFAKKYFIIKFVQNYYPFDKVLKPDTVKRVFNISNSKIDLRLTFEELESELGNIYFQGFEFDAPDSVFLINPRLRIYFEKYQDIQFIPEYLKEKVDSITLISYINQCMQITNVNDEIIKENHPSIYIFDEEINISFIEKKNHYRNGMIEIYSITGIKVIELEYQEVINISILYHGIYFIKFNNRIFWFLKK